MQTVSIQISETDSVRLGLKGNGRELKQVQDKIQELGQVFLWLDRDEQDVLLKMLRKRVLLHQAHRLNRSVKANSVNIQDIVDEVLKVRQSQATR